MLILNSGLLLGHLVLHFEAGQVISPEQHTNCTAK